MSNKVKDINDEDEEKNVNNNDFIENINKINRELRQNENDIKIIKGNYATESDMKDIDNKL